MNIIRHIKRAMSTGPSSSTPVASAQAADDAMKAMRSLAFRLPTHVLPQHYALEFQPNAQLHTFAGAAWITLRITEQPPAPLIHLVLHALNIAMEAEAVHVRVPADPAAFLAAEVREHPSHGRGGKGSSLALNSSSSSWSWSSPADRVIPCRAMRSASPSDTVQFCFESPLPSEVGDVFVLVIERFDGRISCGADTDGLYHSSHTNLSVLSTHLEPTNARRLFPCFDEPAIQATFQLSVITESSLAVISNTELDADIPLSALPYRDAWQRSQPNTETPLEADTPGTSAAPRPEDPPGPHSFSSPSAFTLPRQSTSSAAPAAPYHCVRFQRTPPLHTCIVGFHVGKFTILEQRTRLSRVLCRVVLPHTEPNSSGWFALDLATKALDFFEEFFSVRLPLRKLDVVAMDKFGVLGMENWGMINLHKDYLIVTGTTSLERRQRITRLIGHETCHQWFGNWISIEWWSCLWLKEGMCRYLEYFFVNAIFPSWGLWNEFITNIMNGALLADADPCQTHPVEGCNPAPRRIYDSFDTISYGKGACVLRMMFSIIGTEWLRRAANLLMTRFANRSFNGKDLGDCIVETADARCSTEAQEQHAKAIRYALHMVEAVSHPYLYIRHEPGQGYHITQYVSPSRQHGLLVEYVQSQRSKAGAPAIDLFSDPAHLSYQWTPERTLTPVETPFPIPLRAVQWHRGGHGTVRLIFVEEREHFVPCNANGAAAASTSAYSTVSASSFSPPHFGSAGAPTGSSAGGSGGGVLGSSMLGRPAEDSAPNSPTGVPLRVCYFNHGGGGFYQCDYDMATWRQLFEFAPAFSEEDRMVITMHFLNTAKAQLGCQPDAVGDRCTLFFEWLLRLTGTPGAMNSFLWEIITHALTHMVQLVQQYYCENIVKSFINGLYVPLQKRCVLSFFAQEKAVSFQSSIHLSRSLVLNILQLLCLCENPDVGDEAEETAQWALARVVPVADSPYHAGGSSGTNSATNTTAAAAPLSADTPSAHVGSVRSSAAPSPLSATAALGPSPVRRPSQAELGSGNLPQAQPLPPQNSAGAGTMFGAHSSPVKVVPATGQLLTGSFSGSAARALPAPQLSATPHGEHNNNLFSSFGGPSTTTTDWAGVKNNSIASYPYQRAAELNLADLSHLRAGGIALAYLATQGRVEHWLAAAAVAVEVLEMDREELQRLSGGTPVPVVRLAGLDRKDRDEYLRLVLPAVFSLDREPLFPFMAHVFQKLNFLQCSIVEALYRNSRFLLHLLSRGLLANRRVLNFVITCGEEICSNGFVIAQLKLLAQGGVTTSGGSNEGSGAVSANNSSSGTTTTATTAAPTTATTADASTPDGEVSRSVNASTSSAAEMFRGVEFADNAPPPGSPAHSTAPSSSQVSHNASSCASAAPSTERSLLRLQSPQVARALDMMESNCVWMDYCCSHYDTFLREKRQQQVWRPTRSEANSSMQMSAPTTDEVDDLPESFGGVSI